MNKQFLKFFFLCFLLISINANSQKGNLLELNLSIALDIAQDNNPTIKIAELEIKRIDYSKKEAIGGLFPNINASGDYTNNVLKPVMFVPESFSQMMGGKKYMEIGSTNSYTGAISVGLPLVNFSLWQTIENKANDMSIVLEKLRKSKIDMIKEVKNAYYACLLSKSSLVVIEQSHKNALETLKNVENSYKQGVVSEYDYIRAKVNVNNLNPALINAKNTMELSLMQLRMILSLPSEQEIEIKETLESFNKNINLTDNNINDNISLSNNSDLRLLDYNIKGLQNQLNIVNTQHLPTLTAVGTYLYQTQAEDFNFKDYNWVNSAFVGLKLSIPIFAGMSKVSQANQVKMTIKSLEIQREYAKEGINLKIRAAKNSMLSAKEQLIVNKDAIKQAERGCEIAKLRYNVGSGTIFELNDSELSLLQSKLNYQQSLYNFLVAEANLENIKSDDANLIQEKK